MSKGAAAVIGPRYAMGHRNPFFTAVLHIDDTATWPLRPVLRRYVRLGRSPVARRAGTTTT